MENIKFYAEQDPRFMPFFDYVMQFYGSGGLYPTGDPDDKIAMACASRLTGNIRPDLAFDCDTTDREIVRDLLFTWKLDDTKAAEYLQKVAGALDMIDLDKLPQYVQKSINRYYEKQGAKK